tara:strand:+ start:119 stop:823 length:705 start_codon:yes stop_codon:yes gene_type:complete
MNKESFVYLWYDSRNKMFYLGKHKGTPDDGYTHSSNRWQKFSSDSVPEGVKRRVLTYGSDKDMYELETKLLFNRKEKCWDRYYNASINGKFYRPPEDYKPHTEETKRKISETLLGKKFTESHKRKISEARIGKKHTEETKRNISEAHSGKKLTEETKRKISEAQLGENNSMYSKKHTEEAKRKIGEFHKGKIVTEETKRKMSKAKSGKKLTEETKRKISEARKGKKYLDNEKRT